MLNKMIIQGNFVTTPEIKQTQSGKSVTSFRLAWSETYKEVKSELFVNCVAWGYTAEFISKYFMKGSQIIVEGRLISRSYELALIHFIAFCNVLLVTSLAPRLACLVWCIYTFNLIGIALYELIKMARDENDL